MATTTTYYTGIDLHKRTACLTTVDENGTGAGKKKLSRRHWLEWYTGPLSAAWTCAHLNLNSAFSRYL